MHLGTGTVLVLPLMLQLHPRLAMCAMIEPLRCTPDMLSSDMSHGADGQWLTAGCVVCVLPAGADGCACASDGEVKLVETPAQCRLTTDSQLQLKLVPFCLNVITLQHLDF